MTTPGQVKQTEYAVRVPRRNPNQRFSVLKFNGLQKIDPVEWTTSGYSIRMSRENNSQEVAATTIRQEYGEGSEYGKAVREEARRKKYGRKIYSYQHDSQPWLLSIKDPSGKERKFRSIREGGAGEHADYWVFQKVGDEFVVNKIDDWYQFLPALTHKTLDAEQAEERFRERNRVLNQFALKAQIQKQLNETNEGDEQLVKTAKTLKIKDEASDDDESGDEKEVNGEEDEEVVKKPKKTKQTKRVRKDKKQRVENADEVAAYESDDGDDEGREFDYMSDSGSDSDRDEVPMEQKVDEAMVAVGDEEGLKKLIENDDLSDSDDNELDDTAKKLLAASENNGEDENKKRYMDVDERDSSGSDSDDPDKEVNSALFLPKKSVDEEAATAKKRPAEEPATPPNDAKKPKLNENAKSFTTVPGNVTCQDGLNEETIKRYLRRKPHTTKELLSKIKPKCADMEKSEMVSRLAQILKHISPHQFKQKHGNREVLFFTLTNHMK